MEESHPPTASGGLDYWIGNPDPDRLEFSMMRLMGRWGVIIRIFSGLIRFRSGEESSSYRPFSSLAELIQRGFIDFASRRIGSISRDVAPGAES